jgi:hypothetical protein
MINGWLGLSWAIAITIGFVIGHRRAEIIYSKVFKRYRDEMHDQYVSLLKKHGIYKE